MTVRNLIQYLQGLPGDARVLLELEPDWLIDVDPDNEDFTMVTVKHDPNSCSPYDWVKCEPNDPEAERALLIG